MSKEKRERYRQWYCGLCHRLHALFGKTGSANLTYDMTFLAIFLSSLYEEQEESGTWRCIPHPVKKHPFVYSSATNYAAYMNTLLAYYQSLDDWDDDRNLAARENCRRLKGFLPEIEEKYPRQFVHVHEQLEQLREMESSNELNPDLPANCFGELMGEIFVWREDEHSGTLRAMGQALGRFVYFLDAVNDLTEDLRKERYNPLVAQTNIDFVPMLTMLIAECTDAFETLPLQQDLGILRNVLYSGVWQKYKVKEKEE